jgi:hypothetical protein
LQEIRPRRGVAGRGGRSHRRCGGCVGVNPGYHKMVHGPHRLRWPGP